MPWPALRGLEGQNRGERPQTRQPVPMTLRRCSSDAGTRGAATTARGLLGPGLVGVLRLRLMEV
jgi:hypothetical protein